MAEEVTTILKIETEVKSVNDLRENIKGLKDRLAQLEIGTKEYKDTLAELSVNQNALKDAMYATDASMEDVAKSAQGLTTSYNSLVHKMAELKREFRSTNDEARRLELGKQINEINTQLKDMDALQGNFQRNVGNYKSGLDGLADVLKQMPPTLGATGEQVKKVGTAVGLLGKQPILGLIGLLAPIIMKITSELKENDTAIGAVKRGMEALKPVTDFLAGVLQKIADWLSKAVDWFVDLTKQSGDTFSKIIAGAVGVGNVLLQFVLTPVKSIISAFQGLGNILKDVFTGQFKKIKDDAADAWNGVKDAFVNGFSFKQNFEEGKRVGEEFLKGLGTVKKKAKDGVKDIVKEGADEGLAELEKAFDKALAMAEAYHARMRSELNAFEKDAAADAEALAAEIDALWEAQVEADLKAKAEMEKLAQARVETLKAAASGITTILGAIADAYESEGDESEASANRIKALRVAAATIDTISGAIGAFMQAAANIAPPYGQIVGGIQAAAVVAAGTAQIAKLNAVKVGKGGGSSTPAAVSAPTVSPNIPQYAQITGASQEDLLNRMAGDQRVYILQSDIEAAGNASKTQVRESSF
jgi:archaellum component FlaC